MPSQCDQVKQEYEKIKSLRQEFDLEYDKYNKAININENKSKKAGEALEKVKKLKTEIETRIISLQEKLWPFEALPQKELKKQYEEQINVYRELCLLKTLSDGKEGIKDEEGNKYVVPLFEEICKRIRKNKDFREKTEQGLVKLRLTPFALSIDELVKAYGELIKRKYKEGNLKGEDNELLELDKATPVYVNENFKNLFYFPEWETKDKKAIASKGISKKEAIKQIGGWRITFDEGLSIVPEKGQAKTTKGRTSIEGGMLASEQFQLIKKQKEECWTPEDWLAFAISYLSKENKVIGDDRGTVYLERLLGVCFSASGHVPRAYWDRVNRRAGLGGYDSGDSYSDVGVRSGVGGF
ncbi:hypothetical protein KJ806_02050 [Patescibacteria group bacterium]|nr:hypothetical protein [Patescibacteria group bacterium]